MLARPAAVASDPCTSESAVFSRNSRYGTLSAEIEHLNDSNSLYRCSYRKEQGSELELGWKCCNLINGVGEQADHAGGERTATS